jgi:hypothetical protein
MSDINISTGEKKNTRIIFRNTKLIQKPDGSNFYWITHFQISDPLPILWTVQELLKGD